MIYSERIKNIQTVRINTEIDKAREIVLNDLAVILENEIITNVSINPYINHIPIKLEVDTNIFFVVDEGMRHIDKILRMEYGIYMVNSMLPREDVQFSNNVPVSYIYNLLVFWDCRNIQKSIKLIKNQNHRFLDRHRSIKHIYIHIVKQFINSKHMLISYVRKQPNET